MDKVSALTHFQLEPGYDDYSFLDQAVKDFEHGLDSILSGELEASFWEAVAMPPPISSGFLCLVSTHSDNFRLQLAPSIKCLALGCQARALNLPVPQVGNISTFKIFHHFP